MELQTWQDRQRAWKMILWGAEVSQKGFARDYSFNEGQLSQWLNGKQKIGKANERVLIAALREVKETAPTEENPEWTAEEQARSVSAREMLGDEMVGGLKRLRGSNYHPKEGFEQNGTEVIAWVSSNKGFEDITVRLYYIDLDSVSEKMATEYPKGWYWGESEELVKRPDLIKGVMPWPNPPTDKN